MSVWEYTKSYYISILLSISSILCVSASACPINYASLVQHRISLYQLRRHSIPFRPSIHYHRHHTLSSLPVSQSQYPNCLNWSKHLAVCGHGNNQADNLTRCKTLAELAAPSRWIEDHRSFVAPLMNGHHFLHSTEP